LSQAWKNWRRALVVVHPDTVVRWQRERFRRHWRRLSNTSRHAGRPSTSSDIRELIRTMALANARWRAPRIHVELQKLGINVSERTVSRILRTVPRPPSQTWKTFLQNHLSEIGSGRCGSSRLHAEWFPIDGSSLYVPGRHKTGPCAFECHRPTGILECPDHQ